MKSQSRVTHNPGLSSYAHLKDTYGVVKASDIEENCARLSEPWTPDHTIESLWKRVKDCQDTNGASEAIADDVVIRLVNRLQNLGNP